MKQQRFEIGQAITPKPNDKNHSWEVVHGNINGIQIKVGEIYHVKFYGEFWENDWYISLDEINASIGFNESGFDPVVSDSILISELETIKVTV